MTTFTVPWERCPKEGVIEEDDYRKTCKQIISHADWYGRCGASWESDEIFGMDAASKAHLESLVKVPTLDERCHIHCYNYRTEEMDEYMHTRRLCERYYHFFKVFAVDRKAERVFISPDGPQFMITKCFGANQERADAKPILNFRQPDPTMCPRSSAKGGRARHPAPQDDSQHEFAGRHDRDESPGFGTT